MKQRILTLVVALALVALVVPAVVSAAEEDTVTCTVTAVLLSVTVSDGDVAYGIVALGSSNRASTLGDTQTVTNNGTVVEAFYIKSSNAIRDGGTTWHLGTPGHNEFRHRWDTGISTWISMIDSYLLMASNVEPGNSVTLDLQIDMPSSTDDYLEHSITVTVLATL
jgi:signal recognition particle receptor subunit beta